MSDLVALLARGAGVRDEPELDGLAHALQCGAILRAEHPDDPELAVAGLVHDIADIAYPDDHTDHDRRGAALVEPLLGAAGRAARRRARDGEALPRHHRSRVPRRLSPRSAETLAVQGDALADAELARSPPIPISRRSSSCAAPTSAPRIPTRSSRARHLAVDPAPGRAMKPALAFELSRS